MLWTYVLNTNCCCVYFDCHMIWILFWWVNEAWSYTVSTSYDLVSSGHFPQRLCRLVGPAKLVQVAALICNRFSLCCYSFRSFQYFRTCIRGSLTFTDLALVYHSFSSLRCVNACLHDSLNVSESCLFIPQQTQLPDYYLFMLVSVNAVLMPVGLEYAYGCWFSFSLRR